MTSSLLLSVNLLLFACVCSSVSPATSQMKLEREYIAWTWNVEPKRPDAALPNVLLEGDSLTRNYFPEVQRLLQGKANVYLMANSYSCGDPRLVQEILLFGTAEHVRFAVVHFNNGMHAPDISEEQYRRGFKTYLHVLKRIAPDAQFIWATTTPVKEDLETGLSNSRIDARNAIAQRFVHGLTVDDQHTLMEKHQDLHQDNIHFNPEGAALSAKQAGSLILAALSERAAAK